MNYTTGRILATTNEQNVTLAAIDEDGLGAGPFDSLTKGRKLDYFVGFKNTILSPQDNKSFANTRTVAAYKKKDMLMKGHLCMKTHKLIEETLTIRYEFDHHQRRILISKDMMKKKGIKSPNLFDASNMAVSIIGEVKQQQMTQYKPKRATYSQEDSLFKIAGIG